MLHYEESPGKPQYNKATSPFLDKPSHFALPPPFSRKKFQTPPPPYQSILEKLQKVAQTLASDKPLVSTLSTT